MQRKLWITLIATLSLSLLGCETINRAGKNGYDFNAPLLQDARGSNISTCEGSFIKLNEAKSYLEKYGLPLEIKGNFACEGDKPVLPKSCDGKRLGMTELRAYWEKYQLPVGLRYFDCSTGKPTVPAERLEAWKQYEAQTPTCKDANGKKRPCV